MRVIKQYDTLYLLDACQSLGQLEVDAIATQADFISGTFRNFLRVPRGAGLFYVSDKALMTGLEPLFIDLRGATWVTADPRPITVKYELTEHRRSLTPVIDKTAFRGIQHREQVIQGIST